MPKPSYMVKPCLWLPASWARLIAVAACLAPLVGCGQKTSVAENTPGAVAKKFVEYMKTNEVQKAAELFAYNEAARVQNEDWDTFGEQQRRLIRAKMREDKAELLQAVQPSFTEQAAAGEPRIEGTRAVVPLTGAGAQTSLTLVQEDGQWKIAGF